MMVRPLLLLIPAILSAGCARTPDVIVHYYLARSDAVMRAVRTVGCSPDHTLHSQTTVTATTGFSRDRDQRHPIRMAELDGTMNNSDIGLTFYDDGRLKGINASTAGHGETIVAAAVKLATLAAGIPFAANVPTANQAACTRIRKLNEDGVATFTYSVAENFSNDAARTVRLMPEPTNPDISEQGAPPLVEQVDAILGNLCATFRPADPLDVPAQLDPQAPTAGLMMINLRHPARVPAEVVNGAGQNCETGRTSMWSGSILVPQRGRTYQLPIPRAPFFGKQTFSLTLSEAGMLTALQYGTESGAPGALGALNAIAAAAEPDTAAERAAALQAEADLIFQQERLVRCRANPGACE